MVAVTIMKDGDTFAGHKDAAEKEKKERQNRIKKED